MRFNIRAATKIVLLPVLAVIAGLVAGLAAARLQLAMVPWADDFALPRQAHREANPSGRAPKAVVDQPLYNFGELDVVTKGRHEFIFSNRGDAPLRLTPGKSSCGCVITDLKEAVVEPGQSAPIALQWHSKGREGDYENSGTVETNDPDNQQIRLTVKGRFVALVRMVPAELTFSQISATSSTTGEVRIYCRTADSMHVSGYEFSDPTTAGYFDVHFTPLPAEELKEEPGSRSGVLGRITIKSGLPLGAVRQTIKVATT